MDESKTLCVVIEDSRAGDSKYRQYHVRPSICECGCEIFDLPMTSTFIKDISFFFPDVGPVGRELIKKLQVVDGINRVYLRPYSLTVRKSPVFEWDEIQPDILFALESLFEKPVELKAI